MSAYTEQAVPEFSRETLYYDFHLKEWQARLQAWWDTVSSSIDEDISQTASDLTALLDTLDAYLPQEYAFTNPSPTWVLNHSKGMYPGVLVFDIDRRVRNGSPQHTAPNQVTISWKANQTGYVILVPRLN